MALTYRSSGVAGGIVSTAWWNDYYSLLTGSMSDQPVVLNNGLTLKAVSFTTPTAPTLATASGGSMGVGNYTYAVGFQMGNGLSLPGTTAAVTTTSTNKTVNLSAIATGPAGTTARVLYRSKVGTTAPLYVLHTIADNTTTTYTDTAADASLTTQAPTDGSFGGYLQIQNSSGTVVAQIYNDGTLLLAGGKIGVNTIGDVFDASNGSDTIINVIGSGDFRVKSGSTDLMRLNNNGLQFLTGHSSTPSAIIGGTAGIGFRMIGGTKLAEMKPNGTMVIAGNTYYTTQASAFINSGGSFDSFDFSECFQVDDEYAGGTIVCPKDTDTVIAYDGTPQAALPLMTQCTHDACNLACVIVSVPGFCAGIPNVPSMNTDYNAEQPMKQPIAQSGRVFAKTAFDIPGRSWVCSDGRGGVRAIASGESALAIGVTLSPTDAAMVPLLIRPTFVSLP